MRVRLAIRPIGVLLAVFGLSVAAFAFRAGPDGGRVFRPGDQAAAQAPLPPDEEKRFADAWAQQPRTDLGVPAGAAKVVIVKFNDWLCGGCKQMHEVYQPLLDKYEKEAPGAVKYVVKDWPWNKNCNFSLGQSLLGHEGSCQAAASVRMARDRGKEHDMVAWLFSEQTRLIEMRAQNATAAGDAIKAKATALLGLKPGDFDREFGLKLQALRQDVADGVAVRVQVTPTYYVNGIKTTAPMNPDGSGGYNLPAEYLDLAIRLELTKPAGK
jgi:protein-disulfide isomerase